MRFRRLFLLSLLVVMVAALWWQSRPAPRATNALPVATRAVSSPVPAAALAPAVPAVVEESALRSALAAMAYAGAWASAAEGLPAEFARFHLWSARYRAAPSAALEPEGLDLARARRAALRALIERDPRAALAFAVPVALRAQLPPSILAELETRFSVVGDFTVLAFDYSPRELLRRKQLGLSTEHFQSSVQWVGSPEYRAFVYGRREGQTTKHAIPLHGIALDGVAALHASPLRVLEPGEAPAPTVDAAFFAEVAGRIVTFPTVDALLAAERKLTAAEAGLGPRAITALGTGAPIPLSPSPGSGSGNAALPATAWTVGAKKILYLRVDFSDRPGEPALGTTIYTAAQVKELADTEVSPFFAASSYGKVTLTHTVSPTVYRLPQTAVYYATTDAGLNAQLHLDARTLAAADYTLSNYDRIVVLFSALHNISQSKITYGGLANVGGPYVWVNGEFDFRVVAHELGHTWGLRHANLWKVTDGNPVSTATTAESVEYGDDYDTMSNNFSNSRSTDFNPWFKNLLGWITDAQVQTVTTNGTFRVYRFDTAAAATGPLTLKVVRDTTRSYWIGLRRNFTANPSVSHGAYIIWGYPTHSQSNLLDLTTPGTSIEDAALALNATLVDTAGNISLKPVAEGGTAPAEFLDIQVNVGLNGFPVITAQPLSQGFAVGSTVALSVTATGTAPLTYQWRKAGVDLPGATGVNLTLPAAQAYDAGAYSVRITNSVGTVISSSANISVNALPVIDRPPGHVLALAGRPVEFAVAASGFPVPTYQWRRASVALPGATSATLTLANVQSADAGDYDVVVTNAIGSVTTPAAPLTVAAAPTNDAFANALVLVASAGTAHSSNLTATGETGEPQHNTGQLGATASSVWFRWTPTVSGLAQIDTLGTVLDTGLAVYTGTAVNALTKLKEDDDSGAPGGGGPSLLTLNVTAGTTYSIAVGSFDADPRGAILLNYVVHAAPAINTPPAAVAATLGGTATFTVSATGWNLAYQWSRNGIVLPGATATTLALGSLTAADVGSYTVAVSNPGGTTVSAAATLTGTTAAATILSPPVATTITTGQTATFSVSATAPAGATLAYQWRRNGLALPGATTATYSKSSATRLDADFYDVVVYSDLTPLVSPPVRLSVAPTVYPGFVAPDSAWDIQPEAVNAATGYAVAPLTDGRAYVAGFFSSLNNVRRTSVARVAADGTLDTSFAPPEIDGQIRTLALQSDGKLVIGGDFLRVGAYLRFRVARLNSDGSVDATFDPGTGANTAVTALAVQSDGKILVAGGFTNFAGSNRHALVRLAADGSIDTTFLTRALTTTFGAAAVNALALQSDGRLLVGGDFTGHVATSGTATARNCLVRLEGNGSLDADFGPSVNANVAALLVQSDGRIVAGGSFTSASGTTVGRIVRYLATGMLDSAFATATAAGFGSPVNTLTLLADGKILAGGSFNAFAGTAASCLARLNSDGTRDTTFLTAGVNNTVIGSGLLSTGKILLAGSFSQHTSTTPTTVSNRPRFARLNADGSLDSAVNFTVRCPGSINAIVAVPGGKTVITGFFTHLRGAAAPVGIARINPDGTLDATFNPGGSGANSNIYAAVLQSDGKLVISGFFTTYNGTTANRLARLTTDGALDDSFSAGSGLNSSGYTLALLSAGRIFVGGAFTTAAGLARNRVAVFNSDGTLDSTFDPGTGADSTVYTSHIQADGKILIGGSFTSYNGTTAQRLSRLLTTGARDTTFVTTSGANSDVYALGAQPDGQILIGGFFNAYATVGRDGLARVSATGALDTTFVPPTLGPVYSLILQEDGRVIARGAFASAGGAPGTAFLARFAANGTRDATFGAAGFGPSQFSQSTLAVLRDNGQLVVQSNGSPGVAATQPAALPLIATAPLAQTAVAGTTVTLTVAATSALPLTYQWRRNGTAVPGATATTLALTTLSAANAGTYTVVITSELGSTTSEPVDVALSAPAAITSQPGALTVTAGASATFTVVATGTPTPSYQWQRQAAGTTGFVNVTNSGAYAGATTATLTVAATTAAMQGDEFRCVVTNSAGSPVTSNSALLSVNSPPVITAQPVGRIVSPGATVTFSVTATGTPTLTYQWRRSGTPLAGETNATFTRANVQTADAGDYNVVVTNALGSVASHFAAIILIPPGTTASHTVTRSGYLAGGTATITNTFTYPAGTTSVSLQVGQVAGWTLASFHGPAPTTGPAPGTANVLEWTWTNPPASPLIFSYTLNVPVGFNFTVTTGVPVTFRIDGVNVPLIAQPDPLVIRNAADKHSADTDGDNVISLFELTRVIELYNARSGTERTGRYLVATTPTEDGFAVDTANSTSVLTRHHRADTNTDGRLSLFELTRVIELYNTRSGTTRTGAYHLATITTEDGFAPGP